MVRFGGRFHKGHAPSSRLCLSLGGGHLPQLGALVALVPDQHDGNLRYIGLQLLDQVPDRPQLLQALARAHRIDEDEGMSLGYRQTLHRRKLVTPRCVRYLQRANIFVATYHLLAETHVGRVSSAFPSLLLQLDKHHAIEWP